MAANTNYINGRSKASTREISKRQNIVVPLVMVDNCCSVRQNIQDILGDNVHIGLDLFHAG